MASSITSAVGTAAQSAVSDILGIVPKATLIIRSSSNGSVTSTTESSTLGSLTGTVLSNSASSSTTISTTENTSTVQLSVQYNPSSISLDANAQPIPTTYLLKNTDNGVPNQSCRPPSITLRVELIFDDVNNKDAFAADKLRVSLGDTITAVSAVVNTVTGNYYSVQTETNALVAMLSRKITRRVTFQWADFTFTGEVTQVQARYTMFSPSGRPIRSSVVLDIRQDIPDNATSTYWNEAFDAVFTNTLNPSITDAAMDLLNIGI